MQRKLFVLSLLCLFIVLSLAQAQSIMPYNPSADVNKDEVVDILDLTEVGQAFGSNYSLRTEENRTVVTVLSFARDPPEIEGALVTLGFGSVGARSINIVGKKGNYRILTLCRVFTRHAYDLMNVVSP